MEIPVIRFSQKGFTLYVGKMTAKELLDRSVTTEWDPDIGWELTKQGYQRAPVEKHYRQIGEFLAREKDPLLPTSALLSARERDYGTLDFKEFHKANPDIGILAIPDGRQLFIVDYQHRWRGLRYAIEQKKVDDILDFQVPVVILADAPRYEEIRQFYLINNKQRRIDTDLALMLMQAMSTETSEEELFNLAGPGRRYRIRATRLVVQIAQMDTGPWAGHIQEPNVPPVRDQVASIKSFVDSLRPVVSRRSPVHTLSDSELINILEDYWRALEQLMPMAFRQPSDYSIQKTPGLFVMHLVAARKVWRICQQQSNFSPSAVQRILGSTTSILNESFWQVGSEISIYTSAAAHRQLAQEIMDLIP